MYRFISKYKSNKQGITLELSSTLHSGQKSLLNDSLSIRYICVDVGIITNGTVKAHLLPEHITLSKTIQIIENIIHFISECIHSGIKAHELFFKHIHQNYSIVSTCNSYMKCIVLP